MTLRDPIVSDDPLWYCNYCDKLVLPHASLCPTCLNADITPWDYDAEDVGNHPLHPAEKEDA